MGLLDDAIREHLDLQRRRGADPADIERAEREALGPVRRGPEEFEPRDELGAEPAPQDLDHGHAPEEQWDHPFPDELGHSGADGEPAPLEFEEGQPPPDRSAAAEAEPLGADEIFTEPGQPEPAPPPHPAAGPPPEEPVPEPEPTPAHEPPQQEPLIEHPGEETVEYDVEQELGKHGEDVLEETPEFLQDTPEHDRLWFEQRPPRDFDFDE